MMLYKTNNECFAFVRWYIYLGARRFVHNTIRTLDVSYTNHKNCNVSYTSFVKYCIHSI